MQIRKENVVHPNESFRYVRIERTAFRVARHRHRHLELTWIERGSGLRFLGDSVSAFVADDLVLVGANVPHAWLSSTRGRPAAAVATVVQFSGDLLAVGTLPELRRARPVMERARLGLRITGICRAAVVRELTSMRESNAFDRLAGLIRIIGLLVEHSCDLAPVSASPMREVHPSGDQNRLHRVTAWISEHIEKPLRIANAAEIAHVTPAAFSRFFRREAGKPYSDYVNDVRCGEACLRLRQSNTPVAQIAHDCGYSNLANFNRQFRRRIGATPGEYRRER